MWAAGKTHFPSSHHATVFPLDLASELDLLASGFCLFTVCSSSGTLVCIADVCSAQY